MEAARGNGENVREEKRNRKRQKMSKVWEHFRLDSKNNTVTCTRCNIVLAYHNSTSSMLHHLGRGHPGWSGAETRFRKLRFLPADEVFKVQNAVRAMALAAKQQVRQPTASNHGTSSTEAPAAYAKEATPFFDSDTTTSHDQDEEKQLNAVEQEVLMYFGEHPNPRRRIH
ncbi:hypothetical protein SRHO_G00247090 [Serrasalmus rhombeus]